VQRDSGGTNTSLLILSQPIETINSIPFAGKTVTMSFYARAGANFSSATSAINASLLSGTGTDQNQQGAGYTGQLAVTSNNLTLTTTWQRYVLVGTIPATATELATTFYYTPTGTAGAADYFEITGVQLDLGTYTATTAPTFRRSGGTIQGELAACQRYFQVIGGNITDEDMGAGQVYSTTNSVIHLEWKVPFRAAPTVSLGTGGAASDFRVYDSTATLVAVTSILATVSISINSARTIPVVASGLVAGNATFMISRNSNGRYFVSAEL
jgi:hypothetical protein